MATIQLILIFGLAATSFGDDSHHGGLFHGGLGIGIGGYHGGEIIHGGDAYHGHPVYHAPAHYAYDYGVEDAYAGTNFGHVESRDGYKTEGVYYVHLPDGRLQTVKYYVDEHGYHPEVTYSGVAHHDTGILHGAYH